MEPTKAETPKETVYEIEKMADLKKAREEGTTNISFDNAGNLVVDNRARRRNLKQQWRSVREGHTSIHHYTQKSGMEHPKTHRASKKLERQNRKKGRQ